MMGGGQKLNLRRAKERAKERRIGKLRAQAAKHLAEMKRLAARGPGGVVWRPGPPPPPIGGNRFPGP